MKNRIVSLLLVAVMLLLAVPAFSLAATAEEAAPAQRPLTSSLVNQGENWPTWTNSGYNSGTIGQFKVTPADETGLFGDNWSFGGIINGSFAEFNYYQSNYGQVTYAAGQVWEQGYVSVQDGQMGAGRRECKQFGFSYIAPYTGTVDLSVAYKGLRGGFAGKSSFGIMVDGVLVYPAQSGDTATWEPLAAGDFSRSVAGVEVKAGQRIAFLLNHPAAYDYVGGFDSASVTYTEVKAAEETSYTNDAGANMATANNVTGVLISGEIVDSTTGEGAYLGHSNWSVGKVAADGYTKFAYVNAAGWIGAEGALQNLWAAGNGGMKLDTQSLAATGGDSAVALRYTAEFDGTLVPSVTRFVIQGDSYENAADYFFIALNGKIVWPESATAYNDTDRGYPVTVADGDASAAMTAAMAETALQVKKGDSLDFIMYRPTEADYLHVSYGPAVTYTAINYGPDFANSQVIVNEEFGVKLNLDAASMFAGATNLGAYVDGEFVAAVDGAITVDGIAPKKVADKFTLQPACTLGEDELRGAEITVSVADLLMQHVNSDTSDKTSNLAIATLNYAAAAQVYFGYNTENLANEALSPAQKIVGFAGEYTKEVAVEGEANGIAKIHSATLILRDKVSLKFVYKNCAENFAENYELAVIKDGAVAARFAPTLCEGQTTTYKFILDGVMPGEWNTDYTVAIVEKGADTPVAETVTYGVMTYLSRMQDNQNVDDICAAMLALYEAANAYSA